MRIAFEGKTSELDLTIVGPTGVYIVEVKNYIGLITGDANAHDWQQTKYSSNGKKYDKEFYSPVMQVSTHVSRLTGMLNNHGINAWVQGVVFFVNDRANLNITNLRTCPVWVFNTSEDGGADLRTFIKNVDYDYTMTNGEIERITDFILSKAES